MKSNILRSAARPAVTPYQQLPNLHSAVGLDRWASRDLSGSREEKSPPQTTQSGWGGPCFFTNDFGCQLPFSVGSPAVTQPLIPSGKCFTFVYPSFWAADAAALYAAHFGPPQ